MNNSYRIILGIMRVMEKKGVHKQIRTEVNKTKGGYKIYNESNIFFFVRKDTSDD